MKKQTIILSAVIFVILIVVLASQFVFRQKTSLNLPDTVERTVSILEKKTTLTAVPNISEVIVSVDFGDGNKISGKVSANNAFEALNKIASKENITVEVKQYQFGTMVVKIGQKENKGNIGWTYLVNDKPGQVAADQNQTSSGDEVEWVYKKI